MAFCTEIVCDGCSNCITRGTLVTKGHMISYARRVWMELLWMNYEDLQRSIFADFPEVLP